MTTSLVLQDLRTLGIGWQYRGHRMIVRAVQLAVLDEDRLFSLQRSIFEPIAAHYGVDWRNIERNIRTAIHRAWLVNREYMTQLAGYPLLREPSVTEFLEMLTAHVLRASSETLKR